MKLAGVFTVLQTPLTENDQIDEQVFEREIEWLIECGVDGVVLAMVSEVLRFSAEERRRQWQLVLKLVRGRIPLVASVGAESTAIATMLSSWALNDGVAALMATPPGCFCVPPRRDLQILCGNHRKCFVPGYCAGCQQLPGSTA